MINRDRLITLLNINGVNKDATDVEIRDVLSDARYSNEEINSALYVLKQNEDTIHVRTDGLQKVFYTDGHLLPSEVSGLLGVDYDASNSFKPKKALTRELSFSQMLSIILAAALIGAVAVMYYMFANDIGLFHPIAIAASR
jgi:hypothetical protein